MNDKSAIRNPKSMVSSAEPSEIVRVLLIEDNEDDALIIRETLAKTKGTPFDVDWADRLSMGLERLTEGGIDVVLLDLGLPDSRGLETLNRAHAQASEVPIVVLTGLADETVGLKAVQEGAQDYLPKGQVDGNVLVRAIRHGIERKRAEKALQGSEARFRTLVEKSADGIVIVDQGGVVRFVNPAAEALFGRKANELVGEVLGFPVAAGETTELDIIRKGDGTAVAEMRVVETRWEGENAYLASLHDVTERKQAEEALREAEVIRRLSVSRALVGQVLRDLQNLGGLSEGAMFRAGQELAARVAAESLPQFLEAFVDMGLGTLTLACPEPGRRIKADEERRRWTFTGDGLVERRTESGQPTCSYARGFLCGAVAHVLGGKRVAGVEMACQSMGDELCRFVVQVVGE
jgi:PAS domain-containing protein